MSARHSISKVTRLVVAGFAVIAAATMAHAETINTYSFTQPGYTVFIDAQAAGTGTLSGTFTGTVNSTGLWQESDLSGFSATFSYPTFVGSVSYNVAGLGDLSLFSFNTGSAGDLSVLANNATHTTCVGAPAVLSPTCESVNPNPANTLGVVLLEGFLLGRTADAPLVTLVSSVTSAPAVPEPRSWGMMLLGFGGIGLMVRKKRRNMIVLMGA